jgi:quercetin 2,3-dioxygenase
VIAVSPLPCPPMSGPVTRSDATTEPGDGVPAPPCVEVAESRAARVGGATVRRALPRRERRTVGAWCFADHMGPTVAGGGRGVDVGPHPHIGLQTVTWLLDGELLHTDGLGSEQVIRPGQLNLMTAGRGIAHAEESSSLRRGPLEGIQLWVAQPEATRHGAPAFEHHATLPEVDLPGLTATVLVGSLAGVASPARRDSDHVGVDLQFHGGPVDLPLERGAEHVVVVIRGAVEVDGWQVPTGTSAYLGIGRDELRLTGQPDTRALVLGGVPCTEPVLMWWNYVARERDEITAAHREWTDRGDRFAPVASRLPRIDAGPPPWERTV